MALLLTFCGGIARNNLAWSWLVTLLTTLGVFMKGWVDVRNTARKEEMSRFAYTNHEKTLIELHTFARGVIPTELTGFLIKQQTVEDLITDFAPCKRTSFATAATVATALEMGYQLWSVDEVCHFPQRQTALFRDYINTWLKIKEDASWTGKPEEKAAFIKAYYANEGILLEADKMEYNLGLRSVVKISLNNMWGKLG